MQTKRVCSVAGGGTSGPSGCGGVGSSGPVGASRSGVGSAGTVGSSGTAGRDRLGRDGGRRRLLRLRDLEHGAHASTFIPEP